MEIVAQLWEHTKKPLGCILQVGELYDIQIINKLILKKSQKTKRSIVP